MFGGTGYREALGLAVFSVLYFYGLGRIAYARVDFPAVLEWVDKAGQATDSPANLTGRRA